MPMRNKLKHYCLVNGRIAFTFIVSILTAIVITGCSAQKRQEHRDLNLESNEEFRKIVLIEERFNNNASDKKQIVQLSNTIGIKYIEKIDIKTTLFPIASVSYDVFENKEISPDGRFNQRILKIESKEITNEENNKLLPEKTVFLGNLYSNPGNIMSITGCTININHIGDQKIYVICDQKIACSTVCDIVDDIKNGNLFVPENLKQDFAMVKLESLHFVTFDKDCYKLHFKIGSRAYKMLVVEVKNNIYQLKSVATEES